MIERFQSQAVRAVIGSLAVIAAGCGSHVRALAGQDPPRSGFSAGTIEIAPAGAIVGTSVTLKSRLASNPTGSSLSFPGTSGTAPPRRARRPLTSTPPRATSSRQ